jgi:polyferredoxin
MDKMAYPRGLIRYTTENNLKGNNTRILRPRIFVYAGILITLFIGTIYSISIRSLVELDVIRDRQSLYIETDAGMIENIYSLRIMNLDNKDHSYNLTTTGIEGLALVQKIDIKAKSGEISTVPLRLIVAKEKLQKRTTTINFTLTAKDNSELTITEEARFLGPLRFR